MPQLEKTTRTILDLLDGMPLREAERILQDAKMYVQLEAIVVSAKIRIIGEDLK